MTIYREQALLTATTVFIYSATQDNMTKYISTHTLALTYSCV